MYERLILFHSVLQNSPEVDDEGYSIRPEESEEGEGGDILHVSFD